jgi:DNA-binding HxlR family transcriptional regulator
MTRKSFVEEYPHNRSELVWPAPYMNTPKEHYVLTVSAAAGVLFAGKWRVSILCAMRDGPVRLGQLSREFPEASKKTMTLNLRQLEAEGIVTRTDLSDRVLHVEYDLDPAVRGWVCGLLDHLAEWNSNSRKT